MLSLIAAASQFAIYRAIYINGGAQSMGVWALFAALAAFAQITSLGFAPALLRQVPLQSINNKRRNVVLLLATVNFSNLLFVVPLTICLYFPSIWYGGLMLENNELEMYKSVLPAGFAALGLNNLSSAYLNILDGFSLFFKRAIIQAISYFIFLVLALIWLNSFGVTGVAYAFLSQHIFICICAAISVKQLLHLKNFFPVKWSKWSFQQLLAFTLKIQMSSVLALLFDPVAKYFVTKTTGLTGTAAYEVANKVVMQGRNIMAVASQVITPAVVKNQIENRLSSYYKEVFWKVNSIAFLLSLFWIGCAPFLSYLFVGEFKTEVVAIILVMNIGWYMNMAALPSYYFFIGVNKLIRIVIVHLIALFIMVIVFYGLGHLITINTVGVVPALALFFSAVFNIMSVNHFLNLKFYPHAGWLWLSLFLSLVSLIFWWAITEWQVDIFRLVAGYLVLFIILCIIKWRSGSFQKMLKETIK